MKNYCSNEYAGIRCLSCCYCVVVMVDISPRATRISKRKDFLGVVSFLFMDRRVCRFDRAAVRCGW